MPIRDAARKSKPRQGVLQLRLHDARVTASWASSLPSNPPEVPSASPRSWLSPGPRPARSFSRSTCPSVRDPRVTERCVPSAWIRASEMAPRVAGARGLALPKTRPTSAPCDFAREASSGVTAPAASLAWRPPDGRINPKRRRNETRAVGSSDPLESSFSRLIFPLLRRTLTQTPHVSPHARFSSGGKLPDTVTNPEWAKATAEKMKSWEREGAGPITLNPIKGGK